LEIEKAEVAGFSWPGNFTKVTTEPLLKMSCQRQI